jgi:hypothetical protein
MDFYLLCFNCFLCPCSSRGRREGRLHHGMLWHWKLRERGLSLLWGGHRNSSSHSVSTDTSLATAHQTNSFDPTWRRGWPPYARRGWKFWHLLGLILNHPSREGEKIQMCLVLGVDGALDPHVIWGYTEMRAILWPSREESPAPQPFLALTWPGSCGIPLYCCPAMEL